jgi:hypothetical protein
VFIIIEIIIHLITSKSEEIGHQLLIIDDGLFLTNTENSLNPQLTLTLI